MSDSHKAANPAPHPATSSRIVDNEAVIIHTQGNSVHMLNEVGTRVWELADGTRTTEQIVAILVEEYDVEEAEAERTVTTFVEELRQRGLIV